MTSRRVLVIDDEPYARAGLEALVRKADANATVLPGLDFERASTFTDWHLVDVVFLDLAQPLPGRAPTHAYGQDNEHLGCEVVKHIRVTSAGGRPAVVVVTSQQASFDSDHVRAWLRNAGADGFIYRHRLAEQVSVVLAEGRRFRKPIDLTQEFLDSRDSGLRTANIGSFVDLFRRSSVRSLGIGRHGEDARQKLWKQVAETGVPIGDKGKKARAVSLFDRLTRIVPLPRHRL